MARIGEFGITSMVGPLFNNPRINNPGFIAAGNATKLCSQGVQGNTTVAGRVTRTGGAVGAAVNPARFAVELAATGGSAGVTKRLPSPKPRPTTPVVAASVPKSVVGVAPRPILIAKTPMKVAAAQAVQQRSNLRTAERAVQSAVKGGPTMAGGKLGGAQFQSLGTAQFGFGDLIGGAIGLGKKIFGGQSAGCPQGQAKNAQGQCVSTAVAVTPTPGIGGAIQRILPGGQTGFQVQGPVPMGMKIACQSGFRPNKSNYFLKSGEFVAAGTRCVRNRRRNNMNERALRRALGRVDGFASLERRVDKAARKALRSFK